MRIEWDEPKRQLNLAKHGLDFASLSEEWFVDAHIERARTPRWKATGEFEGRLVVVVIFQTLGSEAFSVISMRRASQKERSRS